MRLWHGYPIGEDQDQRRPWWRRQYRRRGDGTLEHVAWCRVDGMMVGAVEVETGRIDILGAFDAEHPLPAPVPMCGQVWVWPDGCSCMVVYVRPACPESRGWVRWGEQMMRVEAQRYAPTAAMNLDEEPWPPPGAVLVSGPTQWGLNCQWAAMGEGEGR